MLGMRFTYSTSGGPCVYDFAWLEHEAAAAKWKEILLLPNLVLTGGAVFLAYVCFD